MAEPPFLEKTKKQLKKKPSTALYSALRGIELFKPFIRGRLADGLEASFE